MDFTEIKRVIREHYEQQYTNKLDKLGKTDKLLEIHKPTKLTQKRQKIKIDQSQVMKLKL